MTLNLDFPDFPTVGQVFPEQDPIWVWDGAAWSLINEASTRVLTYRDVQQLREDTLLDYDTVTTDTFIQTIKEDLTHKVVAQNDDSFLFETQGLVRIRPADNRNVDIREVVGIDSKSYSFAQDYDRGIKQASDYLQSVGGGTIFFPKCNGEPAREGSHWPFTERLDIFSSDQARLTLQGEGPQSHIRNISVTGSDGGQLAILNLGNYSASGQAGRNLVGGTNYPLDDVQQGDLLIQVSNTADFIHFNDKMPIRLFNNIGSLGTAAESTFTEYVQLNFIEEITNGRIRLRYPIYKDSGSMLIGPGAETNGDPRFTDWSGKVFETVVGFTMQDMGFSTVAENSTFMRLGSHIGSKFRNIHSFGTRTIFGANGCAYTVANNFTGFASAKAVILAIGSHNCQLTNFNVTIKEENPSDPFTAFADAVCMVEENAHHNLISGFNANVWASEAIIDIFRYVKACEHNLITDFNIVLSAYAEQLRTIYYAFAGDYVNDMPMQHNHISNGVIDIGNPSGGVNPVRCVMDLSTRERNMASVISNVRWNNGTVSNPTVDVNILELDGTGLVIDDCAFSVGSRVNATSASSILVRNLHVADGDIIYDITPGDVIITGHSGTRSRELLKNNGNYPRQTPQAPNGTDIVLDTFSWNLVTIGGALATCFRQNDAIEIIIEGTLLGINSSKSLSLSIFGGVRRFTVPADQEGAFRLTLRLVMHNFRQGTIRGEFVYPDGTVELMSSATVAASETQASSISFRASMQTDTITYSAIVKATSPRVNA